MTKDPLDFAYFMIGVRDRLRELDESAAMKLYSEYDDGELGVISALLPYAKLLNVELPEGFEGNFYYEVAEPLGYGVANALAAGQLTVESGLTMMRALMADCGYAEKDYTDKDAGSSEAKIESKNSVGTVDNPLSGRF